MKIRNGFVSNSSSSSFIVFVPKNNNTYNTYNDIKKFFENEFEEIIENDEQYLFDGLTVYKINKYIADGYGLAYINVDYDIQNIESIIGQLCDNYFIYSID
jgi:hypothetical protein